uniref:Serpentine receptor class gamma n=1 Tax=Caenorhabditis japonica TaxID=281687 RepID=A0A8R1HTC8_CAEJA
MYCYDCFMRWRRFAWLMMLGVLLFPFVSTRKALNYPAAFTLNKSTDAYSLTSKMPIWEIFNVLIPFMIVTIIVSLAANIASLIFVKNVKLVKANRAESNFIIITSVTCAIQLIGTILSIGMLTLQKKSSIISILSVAGLFVSDGLTLVQPWLLLFFSHGIRDRMKRMFGLKKTVPVASTNSLFMSRSMTS